MGANTKFGAKEVMDVTLYDMKTGRPVIFFDTLKTSEIAVTSEKVYARGGKGNNKLITWEINKEATLTIEDALISPKSLELVTGMATKSGEQTITMRQDTVYVDGVDQGDLYPLTADNDGAVTLAFEPKETVANIIAYLAEDDCGEPLPMGTANFDKDTKKLTLGAAAANQKVVVYYTYKVASTETYTVDATKFSGTYKLVGDTVLRNANTGKDEAFQVVIPNLKWSSELNLGFSAEGDPSTTSFECEIMKPADSSVMIQMIKY